MQDSIDYFMGFEKEKNKMISNCVWVYTYTERMRECAESGGVLKNYYKVLIMIVWVIRKNQLKW